MGEDYYWSRIQFIPKGESMTEAIKNPSHYAGDGSVECKDAERSMLNGYGDKVSNYEASMAGQALQYLWRFPHKGGIKDLKKCRECIDYLIQEEQARACECQQTEA